MGERTKDNFNYLGTVITRDAYCIKEIKTRFTIAKKHSSENYNLDKKVKY